MLRIERGTGHFTGHFEVFFEFALVSSPRRRVFRVEVVGQVRDNVMRRIAALVKMLSVEVRVGVEEREVSEGERQKSISFFRLCRCVVGVDRVKDEGVKDEIGGRRRRSRRGRSAKVGECCI